MKDHINLKLLAEYIDRKEGISNLSKKVKVSKQTINNILSGKKNYKLVSLIKIIDFLRIPLKELIV